MKMLVCGESSPYEGMIQSHMAEVTATESYEDALKALKTAVYAIAILDASIQDDLLIYWISNLKIASRNTCVIVRFDLKNLNDKQLQTLLSMGVDSYVVGSPSTETLWQLYMKVTNSAIVPSVTHGTVSLIGTELHLGLKTCRLTAQEALILRILMRRYGRPVSVTELLVACGYNPTARTHTIETHVYRLRQRLKTVDLTDVITLTKSVGAHKAAGYRLILP